MALLKRMGNTAAALVAAAVVAWAAPAGAQVLTQDQALALAFPDADEIVRETAYLDDGQLDRIAELAGAQVSAPSSIVPHYLAVRDGEAVGVAYFDAHRVRTLDEVLMVVVDRAGQVERIETVSFREPPEYEAPEGWLALFQGRDLGPDVSLKGEIPTMTGATLTAQAVTDAVRRVLALHRVLQPLDSARTAVR